MTNQTHPSVILIVEDDITLRRFVAILLADAGYLVREAGNGQEALDQLNQLTPQLVLCDLQMPVMDGWTLFARLRERAPALPVVFMSAGANPHREAAQQGAAGWLAKPFDLDTVLGIVHRLVAAPPASNALS